MSKLICSQCGQEVPEQEVLPPTKRPAHRPSLYSEELAGLICRRIALGDSLVKVCEDSGMPDYATVCRWRAARPEFRDRYTQAREDQADWLVDQMLEVANRTHDDWKQNPETGVFEPQHLVVQRAKLILEQMRWNAVKLKPREYSDRVEARLTGEIKHAHAHVVLDARALDVEQRDQLRSLLVPLLSKPAAPVEDEDEG